MVYEGEKSEEADGAWRVVNISVGYDNKSPMRHKLVLTTDAKCTSIIKASSTMIY
jgi:hypothetical protein